MIHPEGSGASIKPDLRAVHSADHRAVARVLEERFEKAGSAQDAAWQKAYMKSALAFHGVSSAEIRAAAKDIVTTAGEAVASASGLVALADHLFDSRWFDVRSAAVALLERKVRLIEEEHLEWLVDLVRRARCWAHVDAIATHLVARATRDPRVAKKRLPSLARDEDFWVRRTALLAQVRELAAGRGDFDLFAKMARPMLEEREFFIRKAIGWVLRETSKKRPELSHAFLKQERARVSGLTLREGAKYLPVSMKAELDLSAPSGRRAARASS